MSEKTIKTRVIHKHGTASDWSKSSLIPKKAELIVFDIDNNYDYERFKIGDGIHNVNELPFYEDNIDLSEYQKNTDDSLTTSSKEISSAINELKTEIETLKTNSPAYDAVNGNLYIPEDVQIGDISVSEALDELNAGLDELEEQVIVERTRIDGIISLDEGSTTGDAELIDIRIGADGVTYESAGTAVRTQINEINGQMKELLEKKDFVDVTFDEETRLLRHIDENGEDVYDPVYISGGGSGTGGTITTTLKLTNQNGVSTFTIASGGKVELQFNFTSTEDDIPTGNGICEISVNGSTKSTFSIEQGLNIVDVSDFLSAGSNTVRVKCTDVYGNYKTLVYTVSVIDLYITSTFDSSATYNMDITFKYTPYGAIEKTIYILVDGDELNSITTSASGKQVTQIIPAMSHGIHELKVYMEAELNDTQIESEPLIYEVMCIEDNVTTPMIASVFNIDSITEGEQISIPYIVYDPTKLACDITLDIYTMSSGSEVVYATQEITVDRNQQYWNTRKYPVGTVYFRIKYGDISKIHSITVIESAIDIEAETNDLELYLSSEGRSNNEPNPNVWEYNDVSTTFTNVNWNNTGWATDENGDACLRLNGDARAEIQFKPFEDDIRTYGKTIELEFAIRDVNNRDAIVIDCMSGDIGFEVKADTAYIKSEQSKVFCNYKDEEKVKLSFVVESRSEYRLLSIYLNGILSDAIQYPDNDNFQQKTPVNITIGSSDCGVDIYTVRSYSTALTSQGTVNNYIADMPDIVEKTESYENNNIYDEYGNISFEKCKEKNSVMVIVGTLPASKGDKKTVKVHYYDLDDPTINYTDTNVAIDVQGTSSQYYVRKNWKLKFSEDRYIDKEHLPAKVICIKVDYAEATGTHNTQNANFVETLYSEPIPPQENEPKCRTTIYGKPILLFHQETDSSTPVFYGKSNMNYDKGAEHVFGFTSDYDVECWEFCNNTSDACNFLGTIPNDWSTDFEARYPDGYTDISRFKVMHDWVVSTKGNVEKFRNEFEDYFDLHYSLIYYVYTFFALMVDQRAKNMFLTYWGETGKFYPYFYDNDTSFGINNEGQLVFDYMMEDVDQLEGANVYNGQNSTLWVNFREAFADEIKETYQNLRNDGYITYDKLVDQFITKGSDNWSESIYNEDSEFKYISMLKSDNDATNLPQVRGSGEEHFRYFVENRLNYCDSKWYASDYANDYVSLRIYTPTTWSGVEPNASITVTPYSNMYAGVRYKANGTLYQKRVEHGIPVTFEAPEETFNDTETAIYGASQISSLGDLAPLYCGSINVASANKLIELKIGDNTTGYSNPNLKELSVGTNKLLKTIDIRNCPNLAISLGLTGCPNIEEIYATGSGITGVELTDGGCLRIAKLPSSIANLTLKNQIYIEDLTLEGYDSLKTLWIENSPTLDTLDILEKAVNVERVRLTNVDWNYPDASVLYELIERDLAGIDENGTNTSTMWVDGKCHIGTLTGAEFGEIKSLFPYLTITYDNLTAQLVYMSEDGTTELHRETIVNGADGTDPVKNGTFDTPVKESTAQYDFAYSGWSLTSGGDADANALLNVESDRTVYVAFSKTIRSYTVNFYTGSTLLYSTVVEYGSDATYIGDTPTNDSTGDTTDFEFTGWKPEPTSITGNLDCYAQFYDTREITDDWATIEANCNNGTATSLYAIGSYKPVEITYEDGTSETIDMEVIAHNHDELGDGSFKWEKVGSIPLGMTRGCSCIFNNEIHAFNGTQHYKYSGEQWTEVDTIPVSASNGVTVAYNSKIHLVTENSQHYTWDATNKWVEVGTIPITFRFGSVVVYDNKIHLMDGEGYSRHHACYDGTEWTKLDNTPKFTFNNSAVVYDNKIYADMIDGVYTYDGTSWKTISARPDVGYGAMCLYNDEIHFIGEKHLKWTGTEWVEVVKLPFDASYQDIIVYDNEIHMLGNSVHYKWSTTNWVSINTPPFGFNSSVIVVHNNELHMMSGYSGRTAHCKFDGKTWTKNVSTLPSDATTGAAVSYNGELHLLGGDVNTKQHYKWNGSTWTSVSTMPVDVNVFTNAVVCDGAIHIFGGNSTSHYKWDGSEWTSVSTTPFTIYRSSAVTYNNEIHLIGGEKNYTGHYKWNGIEWVKICDLPYRAINVKNQLTVWNNEIHLICIASHLSTDAKQHIKYDGNEWTWVDNSWGPIIGFNAKLYRLNKVAVYKSPPATLTFMAKNLLRDDRVMNNTENTNGGWKETDLRTYMNGTLLNSLPSDLQSVIKTSTKLSDGGHDNKVVVSTQDKIWIPSVSESGKTWSSYGAAIVGQGEQYPIFTDNASRIYFKLTESSPYAWWTRSIATTWGGQFSVFGADGELGKTNANTPTSILFGFCI